MEYKSLNYGNFMNQLKMVEWLMHHIHALRAARCSDVDSFNPRPAKSYSDCKWFTTLPPLQRDFTLCYAK